MLIQNTVKTRTLAPLLTAALLLSACTETELTSAEPPAEPDVAGNSDTAPQQDTAVPAPEPPKWPEGATLELDEATATTLQVAWPAPIGESSIETIDIFVDGELHSSVEGKDTTALVDGLSFGSQVTVSVQAVDARKMRTPHLTGASTP